MVSKTGSMLANISAVISYVIAGIIALISILFLVFGTNINYRNSQYPIQNLFGGFGIVFAIVMLLVGFGYKWAAGAMLERGRDTTGAVVSLILGAVSLGTVIGIIGIIAGIFGLVEHDLPPERARTTQPSRKTRRR
jgi:hypothetical protein